MRNLKILNSSTVKSLASLREDHRSGGFQFDQRGDDQEKWHQCNEQCAGENQIQSALQGELTRREGRSLKLGRELPVQGSRPGQDRIDMLIRQQQDSDRQDLQTVADQIAPMPIAPLQGQQHAIDAVRSGEIDGFIHDAEAIDVVGPLERRQHIALDLASAGLLQNAGSRQSHHRIAVTDGDCAIAGDRSARQGVLEGGGNPKMRAKQRHQSGHAEDYDRAARKIGARLGQEQEQGQAQKGQRPEEYDGLDLAAWRGQRARTVDAAGGRPEHKQRGDDIPGRQIRHQIGNVALKDERMIGGAGHDAGGHDQRIVERPGELADGLVGNPPEESRYSGPVAAEIKSGSLRPQEGFVRCNRKLDPHSVSSLSHAESPRRGPSRRCSGLSTSSSPWVPTHWGKRGRPLGGECAQFDWFERGSPLALRVRRLPTLTSIAVFGWSSPSVGIRHGSSEQARPKAKG